MGYINSNITKLTDNSLCFIMKDNDNNEAIVKLNLDKQINLNNISNIVVIGNFKNDTFVATDILTKCPSKYK